MLIGKKKSVVSIMKVFEKARNDLNILMDTLGKDKVLVDTKIDKLIDEKTVLEKEQEAAMEALKFLGGYKTEGDK